MPELPEVETIKNELSPHVVGRQFSGVSLCDAKLVRQPSAEELCHRLVGQKINALERRGKYLMFRLSHGGVLVLHLRMSGTLLLDPPQPDPYTRVVFHLDNGSQLVFSDRRRLGTIWLLDSEQAIIGKLGPEPLAPEFTPQTLAGRLHRYQAPIKAVLLDQTVIAGIGNMYADEALFSAGIHPLTKAASLSPEEVQRLYRAIHNVLQSAIADKGASTDTYKRPNGQLGSAHFNFRVAHRGGKPCPVCGTAIRRLAIRNRGSYFCPQCQGLQANVVYNYE
ncbi:MAG TPA: bifunctional DNA-formamidopyrimidine glycosylase/DNA-(apurinic or apyrimidinic site) lyase [Dehalococcoidia bacterium]|nr:bifunctional DNA-formamidopyrimidine glycosylase/DNA-(apurinic or apyrimidinic site) lyase [Dehalococcoidia bacterium]